MNGLTDYITQRPWLETITTWYVLVDDADQVVVQWPARPEAPQRAASEVSAWSITIVKRLKVEHPRY